MNKQHKHADLIKAWADGAEIQVKIDDRWKDLACQPAWSPGCEYRVKPSVEIPEGFMHWTGGVCPVNKKCIVDLVLRDGTESKITAYVADWRHLDAVTDIIAYKVVSAPVVRWQWIFQTPTEGKHGVTDYFYETLDEVQREVDATGRWKVIGKAEWTRTEFDN